MSKDKNKGLSEEQRLQQAQLEVKIEDFKKRVNTFLPKYQALARETGVDFGIRWEFNPIRGPDPQIVPVDIQAHVDKERSEKAGLSKVGLA